LSIRNNQKLFVYCSPIAKKIFISTIPITEKSYYFRIPFIDRIGFFSIIAGIFSKYYANIEKSNDVSLGTYAIWNVWVTFDENEFSDWDEFDDTFDKLLNELHHLIPLSLKESGTLIRYVSFNEIKTMFTRQKWSDIVTYEEIPIIKDGIYLKDSILKKYELSEEIIEPVILTLYDEFPIIIVQLFDKDIIKVNLKINDKRGALASAAKLLHELVNIKASNTIIVDSGNLSEWIIYCNLVNMNHTEFDAALKDIIQLNETIIVSGNSYKLQ